MAIKHSLGLKNYAFTSGLKGAFDSDGKINIYSGTRPSGPDDGIGGATLLATLSLSATAFGSPSAGVLTAAAITDDSSADASGTATWFRIYKDAESETGACGTSGTDTTCRRIDGDCGEGSEDMVFNDSAIVSGGVVEITSLTITHST
ncbi:MAG: hypothetical protein AB7Q01_08655 [Gammaproteobacteria bacterium]